VPQATTGPRKDSIAELLSGHASSPSPSPQPQPTAHQAALPPARPAPEPPLPIRSSAQPSRQVLAVQRALSAFGYGQLKPTGINDAETRLAVQRFERDRNLPATGEITEQMKRELANLVGHPLD
jgi:hypothetical protein